MTFLSKKAHNRKKGKVLRKAVLALLLILISVFCIFVIFGIKASKNLEISHYTINTNLDTSLRIVHITDLHNAQFGENNGDLIQTIQDAAPDAIFVTGDMINRDDPDLTVITNLISELKDVAPIYYGYGNHEVTWEENFGDTLRIELEHFGATVLQDDYVDVKLKGNIIRIGGCMNYYHKWGMMLDDKQLMESEEQFAQEFEKTDNYKILLNHIPTSWVDWGGMDEYPVDLVFSGHYHGGLIRIPYLEQGIYAPYIGLFPKYTKGIAVGKKTTCIQSAGLGTEHRIPRIFNPPEVVIVDLEARQ